MKLREASGCVNRASEVQVFVLVSDTAGMYLPISKPQARQLLDRARTLNEEDVDCEMVGSVCRLGVEHTIEDDDEEASEAHPVCSECGLEWGESHVCPDFPDHDEN